MLIKKYIALDIGYCKTKIVYGGLRKDKIVILEYDIIDTPPGCIRDGKITDATAISHALSTAFKKNKIKKGQLIYNITGTGIITRDVSMPRSSNEELEKMLKFEAQQYFPVDLESYEMDFKPLEDETTPEGNFTRIQLVAVPTKQLDEFMNISDSLKRETLCIDIHANNLSRFLEPYEYFYEKHLPVPSFIVPGDATAVLDLGYETTGVCVFSKGILKFHRSVLNGMNSFVNDMTHGEAFNEAAAISEQEICSSENLVLKQAATQDNITLDINSLLEDIQRLFDFYNTRNPENKVKDILLYGGGSMIAGIDTYLTAFFNKEVKHINTDNKEDYPYILYKGRKPAEEFDNCFPLLINAIGALVKR